MNPHGKDPFRSSTRGIVVENMRVTQKPYNELDSLEFNYRGRWLLR